MISSLDQANRISNEKSISMNYVRWVKVGDVQVNLPQDTLTQTATQLNEAIDDSKFCQPLLPQDASALDSRKFKRT